MKRAVLLALLPLASAHALAEDTDDAALQLADSTPATSAAASRDWRLYAELAAGRSDWRYPGLRADQQRLSLDLQLEHSLAPGWRLQLADRLDIRQLPPPGEDRAVHTLKEAYLGWRPQPDTLLDLGRVNVRHGVASGYNPTDFFRDGSVRAPVSLNPASLKENRLGSVMLRGQQLWHGGALTVLYAPKLDNRPSRDGTSADLGASNPRERWLLALSQQLGGLSPQWLLYREAGRQPQLGANLSTLLTDASTAYLEWSGGRNPGRQPATADTWRNRLAGGISYTTADKLTISAELHYDGNGLGRQQWQALQAGPLPHYAAYRSAVQHAQILPTRRALFLLASWQDARPRLDLTAMHNRDLIDRSQRWWLEARYRADGSEYVLQWQRHRGTPLSQYGALPEAGGWQALWRVYF